MTPVPIAAVLCSTEPVAVAYAAERSAGKSQEMAIDAVGRRAGKTVCGVYRGKATAIGVHVVMKDGCLYRVTAWRFVSARLGTAYRAEATFAAEPGDGDHA